MQAIHRKHRKLHFLQIVFSVLKFVLPKLLLSVTENILLQKYFLVQNIQPIIALKNIMVLY